MDRKPWMKFFPQDWKGDSKLRACSIGARGLWIELIALAHEATPYGHVLINGNAPELAALARMTGTSEAECESLLSELEANGVFSRTRQGIIYSRRMVKDAKKAVHAQRIGKTGGNPSLSKDNGILPQVNPQDKGDYKPQRPEARGQKEKEKSEKEKLDASFEAWWSLVPLKKSKGAARRAFPAALKRASLEALMEGIKRYAAEVASKEPRFIKHPSTWLNGDCWLDEPARPNGGNGAKPGRKLNYVPAVTPEERRRLRTLAYAKHGTWDDSWGPPPGADEVARARERMGMGVST